MTTNTHMTSVARSAQVFEGDNDIQVHHREACGRKIALHVDAAISAVDTDPAEAQSWAYDAGKEAWDFDIQMPEKLAPYPLLSAAFKRGFDSVEQASTQRAKSIPIETPCNATIQEGILTMPDGTAIDLKKVQAALNFGFQETGELELMEACEAMSKITRLEQGPSGEFVSAGRVPNSRDSTQMIPAWSQEHCEAAQREGWDIFDTDGSGGGAWQVQRLDDASEVRGALQLKADAVAWRIVVQGTAPHHEAARQFIQAHNPQEWAVLNQLNVPEVGGAPKASAVYLLSELSWDDSSYGEGLPVAGLFRVTSETLAKIDQVALMAKDGILSIDGATVGVPSADVVWLNRVGFTSENTLASVPGFFDAKRDQVLYISDVANMEIDGERADFAPISDSYPISNPEDGSSGLRLQRDSKLGLVLSMKGRVKDWAMHGYMDSWQKLRDQMVPMMKVEPQVKRDAVGGQLELEAKDLVTRIEADIVRLRDVCIDPMSIKIAPHLDIEVRPAEDDDRVLVGREGWGCTVVNFTSEGLMLDVFRHEELEPIHSASIYASDFEGSNETGDSPRPGM